MATWIEQIVNSTEELESPERYYYWCGLAAIAAAVRKNVYLEKFSYKLYPNIYVLLVGRSGLRKGAPITLARNLVGETKSSRIIMGRHSIQEIIQELGKAHTHEDGTIARDAHGMIISGELASFFVKDPDALTILTDLYDTHAYEEEWKNSLKMGKDVLKSPCLTLIGATNEAKFQDVITSSDVEGGFIARTFIVYENEKRCINSLINKPKNLKSVKELTGRLHDIAKLKGEFQWDSAKFEYDRWYTAFSQGKKDDPTGTLERVHDGILKVAMLLSLADNNDLFITNQHLEESIDVCLKCTGGMRQVVMGQGTSSLAGGTKLVIHELLYRPDHRMARSKLLQKYWGQFDSFDLDRIVATLEGANAIDIQRCGKETIYVMRPRVVDEYIKYKAEIN